MLGLCVTNTQVITCMFVITGCICSRVALDLIFSIFLELQIHNVTLKICKNDSSNCEVISKNKFFLNMVYMIFMRRFF